MSRHLFTVALLTAGLTVYAQAPEGIRAAKVVAAAADGTPDVAVAAYAVDAERADLRSAASAFVPQLTGDASAGRTSTPLASAQRASGASALDESFQTYRLGIQRSYRNGVTLTPSVQMTRTHLAEFGALVETSAGLEVRYPLLGGASRSVPRASEISAQLRVDAAELDLEFARERSIANGLSAYWTYVGARRTLDESLNAEERARQLRDEIQRLVDAGERPAADVGGVSADLARRTADRLGSEQALYEARLRLALAMGQPSEAAAQIGSPLDPLPTVPDTVDVDEPALIERALANRYDLQAATARLQAADRVLGALVVDARPSADAVVDIGYVGLAEGAASPHQFVPLGIGTARGGRIEFSLKFNRLGGSGPAAAAARQRAARDQARVRLHDLARQIEADVVSAVAETRSRAAEVHVLRASVEAYDRAVFNERRRLQLGIGTLFDTQNAEERLATASALAVAAEVRYAQALIRLRLAVGATAQSPVQN